MAGRRERQTPRTRRPRWLVGSRGRGRGGLDAWSAIVGGIVAALAGVIVLLAIIGPPHAPEVLWLAQRADLARTTAWLAVVALVTTVAVALVAPTRVRLTLLVAWSVAAAIVLWTQHAQAYAILQAAW